MGDIVKSLRLCQTGVADQEVAVYRRKCGEAADEIERLRSMPHLRELSTMCGGSAFCEDAQACIKERDDEIARLQRGIADALRALGVN